MRRTLVWTLMGLLLAACPALAQTSPDAQPLAQWQAGERVSPEAVARYGIDRCFVAEGIGDSVFARIWKKSFKENCSVPRSDLRYVKVLHRTLDGHIQTGELICHKAIAQDLLEIFRQLYEARYPIERMVLIDEYGAEDEASMTANNTSCFNFRRVSGSRFLSRHSTGRAIDINPLYNPCVRTRADGSRHVEPAAGRPYADRTRAFSYKIDRRDLCYRLFTEHGFRWGGDWRSTKDYQHFEKAE